MSGEENETRVFTTRADGRGKWEWKSEWESKRDYERKERMRAVETNRREPASPNSRNFKQTSWLRTPWQKRKEKKRKASNVRHTGIRAYQADDESIRMQHDTHIHTHARMLTHTHTRTRKTERREEAKKRNNRKIHTRCKKLENK